LLDAFTSAFENYHNDVARPYDLLLLRTVSPTISKQDSVYQYLMESCGYISRLTDGSAVQIFQKVRGNL